MRNPQDSLPPNIIRRDKWDAAIPKVINFGIEHPVNHVLLDNTGTEPCATTEACTRIIKQLQTQHMGELDLPDIKQNFIIGGDGNIYVGRGWVSEPSLPEPHSARVSDTMYFSFFGPKGKQPTEEELKSFNQMVDVGKRNEFIVQNPTIFQDL